MIEERTEGSVPKAERRRAHQVVPEAVDVAIIGSGLGGLVAGAYLARSGLTVAVFEQHYVAGGCATQFARGPKKARYHFDVGLHYIGDCEREGTIPSLLRGVGVELSYERLDPDGFDTLVFPGLEFRIPADLGVYRDRLCRTFPRERRAIDRYVRLVRATMKATRMVDQGARLSLRAAWTMGLDALRLGRIHASTIHEVLDGCGIRDPRLRGVILGQSGDYGVPPSEASALLHLGLAGHYFRGAYYPRGGGQVIADRLAETIEKRGGGVHLRRGIERILVGSDGAARGVRLEARAGEPPRDVRARAVLSNADLSMTLFRLLGAEHLPASWAERASGYKMAAALFMTFLGVSGDLRAKGMRPANYWVYDDFDLERAYRAEDPRRTGGVYVTSASLKDPSNAAHHAPAGITNVEVMTLVPPTLEPWGVVPLDAEGWRYGESAAYRERKAALEEQMVGRLDALFPGAARAVVFRESATPVSHARFTRATGGTGYGLAATPSQFMGRRPGYRGPIPGLYLCGASTRSGHGIVGAMLGGRQAAMRIAKDLGRAIPLHDEV
ncbi:MAG TPA: NAD(P)/FAD-dependent oxidoreductase [Polyangiaceae bacterium]|jgi:phytoene dehydrogenase-like protein